MEYDVNIKEIDLRNNIREMIESFKSVKAIYLFGSRAYKTNSTRSDVDVIVFSDFNIPPIIINNYHKNHEYIDIFAGSGKAINSITNGSTIIKRGLKSLVRQLDAILLWSSKKGYCNEAFYKQSIFAKQRFYPSSHGWDDEFSNFKKKINNSLLSDECSFFLQESTVDYINGSYASCVSMLGLACECLINQLFDSCSKKYIRDGFTTPFLNSYCSGIDKAKLKIEGIINYINDNKSFFDGCGFCQLKEKMCFFEVVRQYRNNADHPLGYTFSKEDCNRLYSLMTLHFDNIINFVNYMNVTYP